MPASGSLFLARRWFTTGLYQLRSCHGSRTGLRILFVREMLLVAFTWLGHTQGHGYWARCLFSF